MQFARVTGTLSTTGSASDGASGEGQLVVTLDTGHRVTTVREEDVPLLPSATDLSDIDWSADQYTQETIAVDLAEQGWEAFGVAADEGTRQMGEFGTSATYLVRRSVAPSDSSDTTGTSR